jgi:hypothetical protein
MKNYQLKLPPTIYATIFNVSTSLVYPSFLGCEYICQNVRFAWTQYTHFRSMGCDRNWVPSLHPWCWSLLLHHPHLPGWRDQPWISCIWEFGSYHINSVIVGNQCGHSCTSWRFFLKGRVYNDFKFNGTTNSGEAETYLRVIRKIKKKLITLSRLTTLITLFQQFKSC